MRQSPPSIGITILSNPARNRTRSVPPVHEKETLSSAVCRSSSPSPAPPPTYTILSNPARARSLPSVQNAHSSSSPSVLQSHSSPRITILTNPARENQRAMEARSAQSTQGNQNASAAVPASMRVPTATPISILKAPIRASQAPAPAPAPPAPMRVPTATPISILKAPIPASQAPAPAAGIRLSKPAADAKVQNLKVKFLLPEIVVHELDSSEARAKTGVHQPGTGTDTGATKCGDTLGVPVVTWRSKMHQNDLARYYPEEHAAELIARRHRAMVRNGSRLATARRREHPRQCRQTTPVTASATTSPTPSVALIVSRINARVRAQTSTLTSTFKRSITPTAKD